MREWEDFFPLFLLFFLFLSFGILRAILRKLLECAGEAVAFAGAEAGPAG